MTSTPPMVSVLLPVRDAEPHLDEALASLAGQTLTQFEVIAVDDGSRDGSRERLERRAADDPRFRVIEGGRPGLVGALNHGLSHCRAAFVARMDADDVAAPRRLELQAAALAAEPDLDVVSSLVRHFPEEDVAEGFRHYERWLNSLVTHDDVMRERFIESPLPHPSVMLRRDLLEAAGGYRDVGWPEDYDLWLRLAEMGCRFRKLPEILLFWRDHADRLTRTDRRYAVERFLACKAHYLARGPLRAVDRVIVWGAGQTGRRLSKHLLREGAPLTAFIDIDEAKIGRTLKGLPIQAADELPLLLEQPYRTITVSAVSSRGARELIRARLCTLGLVETREFWCAA